jgi:hypothetical protein
MGLFRGLLLILVLICGFFSIQAQTADEVIEKHIEAIGGKDAWKKVISLEIDGILTLPDTDVNVTLIQLDGKGMRQNISIQGVVGYQIVTPTAGWTFLPFQGQTEVNTMSQEDVKLAQNELDVHPSLLEYAEKGHVAELAGTESIGGSDCFKVFLILNSGNRETFYIDSRNYYLVRTITKQIVNGREEDIETNYSDFEKIPEGLVIAKAITFPYGTMAIKKVEVNSPVDENVFKPIQEVENGPELR